MSSFDVNCGTIWVCQCCMLQHANGECCPDDEAHGGDGVEPWSEVDFSRYAVTMGLSSAEHACGQDMADPARVDCDCERNDFDHDAFSASTCGGCGSRLAGPRWAFGLWTDRHRVHWVTHRRADGREFQFARCSCGSESFPIREGFSLAEVAAGHAVDGMGVASPSW